MVSVAWPAMRAVSLGRYCPWAQSDAFPDVLSLVNLKIKRLLVPEFRQTDVLNPFEFSIIRTGPAEARTRFCDRNPARVAEEVENAQEGRIDDALNTSEMYREQEGFPRKSLLNKLITTLAQMRKLDKAYDLVLSVIEAKKQGSLLNPEAMSELCLSLAKADNPVPASSILRILVQMEQYPPVDFWVTVESQND